MTFSRDLLYVSDLDGTLLTPDGWFPDSATDRLNRLLDWGLNFSIATARNYDSVYPILSKLRLNLPVILFNGVYLTDFRTGKNIALTDSLCPALVNDLMALAERLKIDPFVYTCNGEHHVYYRNLTNECSKSYVEYISSLGNGERLQYVPHYEFLKTENVPGILFIDTFKILSPLYQALSDRNENKAGIYFARDISQPKYYWLQIFHSRANKGNMLTTLATKLGIPLRQTVVFGDYLNDLEMFRIAGKAVAVKNALPEVREAADEIIGTNADLAVIDYLESVFDTRV